MTTSCIVASRIVAGLCLMAVAATASGAAQAQQKSAKPAPVASAKAPAPDTAGASAAAPSGSSPASTGSVAQAGQAAAAPGWVARCTSAGRKAPLDCVVEQQSVLEGTGRQLTLVSLRVPSDAAGSPALLVQLPLGLYLPAGATLQIDAAAPVPAAIQSCDQRACYVGMPVTPALLEALQKGEKLVIGMQSISRQSLAITHPLRDFASAYQQVRVN